MTDRLSVLLREEAAALEVPPVPGDLLAAGHRELRNRRTRTTLATALVVLLVTVGVSAAVSAWLGGDDTVQPADRLAYEQEGAWARGDEVHVGNHVVVVPGTQALQYSSAGVVVTTEDGGFVLVTPDGDVQPLHLPIRRSTPRPPTVATDPTQPYLAYVRAVDDAASQLVVRDLGTGAETTVGDPFPEDPAGASEAQQLWDTQVFWFRRGDGRFVDWQTGERVPYPDGPVNSQNGFGHGVTIGYDPTQQLWVVTSRSEDSRVLELPVSDPASAHVSLSVDGRYLAASTDDGFDVHDVAAGTSVHFGDDRDVEDYGWTPDGHLVGKRYRSQAAEVEVCDPRTGTCDGTGDSYDEPLTLVSGPYALSY
ncbi:hypothetical protein [Nocardioides aquiterrae]|uniref:WD40 repeat domain-containing protein n=1 Tax=Nocardioides aquiterrae TaxID=203799 RepID=A0ABN1US48_9ACTN